MPERVVEVNPPAGGDFVSVFTFLPVRRWKDVIPFLRMSSRVTGQLMKSDVVRFGVKTDLLHKRFMTLSVWSDREAMRRFASTEPHATAVRKFAKWAGKGAAFVEWKGGESSIDWDDAMKRLDKPTFYFKG
jgi:hypothetical protein